MKNSVLYLLINIIYFGGVIWNFQAELQLCKHFQKKFEKDYSTKHKLQRQEGQWSTTQKSLLIDSLLRSIPIDPVRCELKENEDGTKVRYIFDGVQRSTTIVNFCKDGFKLKLPGIP
ncbi:MAG: DUF262 domain-containing protein [Blautia caecimuris]